MQKNLQLDMAEANISEFPSKHIQSVARPRSLAELQQLLSRNNHSKTPLFVTSTGKNWALGSKQPVTEQNTVVVLEQINRIIDVNERYRYAIIEPGVTQKQLSDYLSAHHPQLMFPVTGSAENTSIVGNMLERGVAFGFRSKQLVAMEVMLASGELIKTGSWRYFNDNNPLAFHYAPGHGPDLRGLFTQSNLAITTKMVIRLQLKRNTRIFTVSFKEDHLQSITNSLRGLYEQDILDDGLLITNLNDPRTTSDQNYRYNKQWCAFANFSGDPDFIALKLNKIKRALGPLENGLEVLPTGTTATWKHPYHQVLTKAFQGIPSNYSLETMAAITGVTLDDDNIDLNPKIVGMVCCLPAVPFEGEQLLAVRSLIDQVSRELGVMAYHNYAAVDELTFEGYHRIYFDREDSCAVKIAHRWHEMVHRLLREKGFFPYRIDNRSMNLYCDEDDNYWQLIKQLKDHLDPNHIISPGKYNLS